MSAGSRPWTDAEKAGLRGLLRQILALDSVGALKRDLKKYERLTKTAAHEWARENARELAREIREELERRETR